MFWKIKRILFHKSLSRCLCGSVKIDWGKSILVNVNLLINIYFVSHHSLSLHLVSTGSACTATENPNKQAVNVRKTDVLFLTDRYPAQEDLGPRLPQVSGADARGGRRPLNRPLDPFPVSSSLLWTDVNALHRAQSDWQKTHTHTGTSPVLLNALTKSSCSAAGNS